MNTDFELACCLRLSWRMTGRLTLCLSILLSGVACSEDSESPPKRHLDYIHSAPFDRLVIEVDRMVAPPDPKGATILVEQLASILDKPGGIEFVFDDKLADVEPQVWEVETLRELAASHRSLEVGESTAVIHTLYVDGSWHEDTDTSKVFGLTINETTVVLFPMTIKAECEATFGQAGRQAAKDDIGASVCRLSEVATWYHEIGHLLGLVDNGLEMVNDHKDPDPSHGNHDVDESCIMYWSNSSSALIEQVKNRVEGGNLSPLGLGPECLADLAAARGN